MSRIVSGVVSSLARCKRHSLACGPDGLCVLCRKDARSKPARLAPFALVGGALLVAGSAVAYGARASRAAALDVALGTRPLAPAAELPMPIAPGTDDGLSAARARAARVALERQRDFQAFQAGLDGADGTPAVASVVSPEPAPEPAPAPAEPPAPAAPASIEGLRVVVYTTSWCPVCKRAKAWMTDHGIPYEEHDIEASSDDARSNKAINPRGSIPTFDIEGNVMVGFSEGELVATLQRAARMRGSPRPY